MYGSARTEVMRGIWRRREARLNAIELRNIRGKFSVRTSESRCSQTEKAYETYVDVLMRLTNATDRSTIRRRFRFRNWRGTRAPCSVNETRADIRQEVICFTYTRTLLRTAQRDKSSTAWACCAARQRKQLAEVEQEWNALLSQHQETQAQIRARSPSTLLSHNQTAWLRGFKQCPGFGYRAFWIRARRERSYPWFVPGLSRHFRAAGRAGSNATRDALRAAVGRLTNSISRAPSRAGPRPPPPKQTTLKQP